MITKSLLVVLAFAFNTSLNAQNVSQGRTAIIGAMEIEVKLLVSQLAQPQVRIIEGFAFTEGLLDGHPVVVARVGVGKVNAAIATTLLIEHFRPREVIFTGVAGALDPGLRIGDIVLAQYTVHHDFGEHTPTGVTAWATRAIADTLHNPVNFPADTFLLRVASGAHSKLTLASFQGAKTVPRVIVGTVLTGDVFIASSTKKQQLRDAHQGHAVEMEGAAVAQVCWQLGRVPLLIIRSISDNADDSARETYTDFRDVAARNSALLVRVIVGEIQKRTPTEAVK